MPTIDFDLIERFSNQKREFVNALSNRVSNYTQYDPNGKFQIGDKILFVTGYYNHLLAKSEIIGFDENGGIYPLWDCYWAPIYDTEIRNIRKVNN